MIICPGICLEEVLLAFKFLSRFMKLVINRVRTCMFSILINGYFSSKKRLKQGDPMPPLLFLLCMDYFTRIMNKMTASGFTFHKKCKELKLSHLCFTDDLF